MKVLESLLLLVLGGIVSVCLYLLYTGTPITPPTAPISKPAVDPDCPDGKCPPKKPRSPRPCPNCPEEDVWKEQGVERISLNISAKVAGPKLPDGTEIHCDYPGNRHKHNIASKGLGCCVFRSLDHAGDWQDVAQVLGMPEWMVKNGIAGGGYPAKVAELIPRISKDRKMPTPDYLQIEDAPEVVLPMLQRACEAGRMPCITYYVSPTGRYGGRRISHMVNLPHFDGKTAAVLDNNYVGEDAYEWMSRDELIRCSAGGGKIWAVIFLAPPPPMPPFNTAGAPPRQAQDEIVSSFPLSRQQAQHCGCPQGCECGCNKGLGCSCPAKPTHMGEGWEWRDYPEKERSQIMLFRHGVQQGVWHIEAGYYRTLLGNAWGPKQAQPPIELPEHVISDRGVQVTQLATQPRYRRNGHTISKQEAINALEELPNDRAKRRLIVISENPAEREQVLADMKSHPSVATLRDNFVVKGYAPDHWHIAKYGFYSKGRPTIQITEPSGKSLWRQDDYKGGPELLAVALRRLQPSYDPAKDPGPNSNPLGGVPWSVPAVGLGVSALLIGARVYARKVV